MLVEMTDKEYFAFEALSNSGLKEILKSPAHFQVAQSKEWDGKSLRIGSAVHQLLLGGDEIHIFDGASFTSKAGKEFKEKHEGAKVILASEYSEAGAIAEAAIKVTELATYITQGQPEQAIITDLEGTSFKAKAKADILVPQLDMIVDIKTTSDIGAFERSIFNYGYYIQAAWYTRLFSQVMPIDSFLFAAIETIPPYTVDFFELEPEVLEFANEKVDEGVKRYIECMTSGKWPNNSPTVKKVGLPGWLKKAQ